MRTIEVIGTRAINMEALKHQLLTIIHRQIIRVKPPKSAVGCGLEDYWIQRAKDTIDQFNILKATVIRCGGFMIANICFVISRVGVGIISLNRSFTDNLQ